MSNLVPDHNPVAEEILAIFNIVGSSGESNDYSTTVADTVGQQGFEDLANELSDAIDATSSPQLEVAKEEDSQKSLDTEVEADNIESGTIDFKDKKEDKMSETNKQTADSVEELIRSEVSKPSDDEEQIDFDDIFSQSIVDTDDKDCKDEIKESLKSSKRDGGKVKDSDEEVVSDGEFDSPKDDTDLQQGQAEEPPKRSRIPAEESLDKGDNGHEETKGQPDADEEAMAAPSPGNDWILKSPTSRYDRFYSEKRSMIPRLLIGGPIPFDKYGQELRRANVELDVRTYNPENVHARMVEVQKWRDRVQEIYLHANDQYYVWDNFIEMCQGMLIRLEPNLKPADARKALFYEHLRDMIYYYDRLRSVHTGATAVLKNLEAAFDTLNRQVTIAIQGQNREPDRTSGSRTAPTPQRQNHPKAEKEELAKEESSDSDEDFEFGDFDKLEGKATIETKKKATTDFVDWD